ncbi:MAG: hypothetical protein AABY44_09270 [Nitrospirota bacterium]
MDDISLIEEAIKLEMEAEKRYAEQIKTMKDPFLVGFLEGLRRNEEEHGNFLRGILERLKGG